MNPLALDTKTSVELRGDPAKRRQIIEGARHVFLREGFDATSMGAVAREAGVSKGTLYVYFESKEELFEAIVEEQCREQAEQIFNFNDGTEIDVELMRMGEKYVQFLCKPARISPLRTVIAIADRMPLLGAKFYQSGPAHGIASLKRYFDGKVAQGILIAHDTEVAAAQFLDSCSSLSFKRMLFNFAKSPTHAEVTHIVGMAVKTYLAAYGRR